MMISINVCVYTCTHACMYVYPYTYLKKPKEVPGQVLEGSLKFAHLYLREMLAYCTLL